MYGVPRFQQISEDETMHKEIDILSIAVQLICVISTVWLSVKYRKKSKNVVFCISAAIMFVGNFIGPGLIMGGGPDYGVGLFLNPILGVIISRITMIIMNIIDKYIKH
jgi:hypothetical protein